MKVQIMLEFELDSLKHELEGKKKTLAMLKKEYDNLMIAISDNLTIEDYMLLSRFANSKKGLINATEESIKQLEEKIDDIKRYLDRMEWD